VTDFNVTQKDTIPYNDCEKIKKNGDAHLKVYYLKNNNKTKMSKI
jgi:hypothetical protein